MLNIICYLQVFRLPSLRFQMKLLNVTGLLADYLPGSSLSYNLSRGMAGHSKWSNIRHIKAAKDAERQKLFIKYTRMMKVAVKGK